MLSVHYLRTEKYSQTSASNEVQLRPVFEDDEEYLDKEVAAAGLSQEIRGWIQGNFPLI